MKPRAWWRLLDRIYLVNHGERRCHYCGRSTTSKCGDTPMCRGCWRRS